MRLVIEHRDQYETKWAAITSIAEKFGCSAETLRGWVRRAEIDGGLRPGDDERPRPADQGARAREQASCAGPMRF